ncbi:uncharacterized protein LOC131234550 [Magnolia sinica]|uniref:uncharacterized protein LOC131234550 n=1 Tax=Magnolia sinica TaxID=86752 RepID=UPI0026580EB8|nr:uncharacterized protein LOC131234550 [Magnolia sinica]
MAEVLSRGLKMQVTQESILPFKLGRGCPVISHLLYTDDTLLFLNGSVTSMRVTKEFLDDYQVGFGHSINFNKSSFICGSSLSPARIRTVERASSISRVASPSAYLGVPLVISKFKAVNFQPLVERVKAKISSWKARFLSKQVLSALKKRIGNFLWGWLEGKRKLHWRRWKANAVPKEEGGLNIHRLSDIMVKYVQSGSANGQQNTPAFASPMWKKIVQLFPRLDEVVQIQLRAGDNNLWSSNWTGLGPLQRIDGIQIPPDLRNMKINPFLGRTGRLPPLAVLNILPQAVTDLIFQAGYYIS